MVLVHDGNALNGIMVGGRASFLMHRRYHCENAAVEYKLWMLAVTFVSSQTILLGLVGRSLVAT